MVDSGHSMPLCRSVLSMSSTHSARWLRGLSLYGLVCLCGTWLLPAWQKTAPATRLDTDTTHRVLRDIAGDLEAGRFREAQAKAEDLVAREPRNALGWTYLGMASVRLARWGPAIDAFERAIAINPKDPRSFFDVALAYATRNDLDHAIDRYRAGLAIDPRNGSAQFNYGQLLMRKRRFAEAARAFTRAAQIDPNDHAPRIAAVEALVAASERQQAQAAAETLLAARELSAQELVHLGGLLVRDRDIPLASRALNRALTLAPQSAEVHSELSRLALARGDFASAGDEARSALELAPDSLAANLGLAEVEITARREIEAKEFLEMIQPRFERAAAFHYTLGIALYRARRFSQAIASFRKAVELEPGLDLAHFLLGSALLGTGDLVNAEASFKAAIAAQPFQVLYYDYLARVYEENGPEFRREALKVTQQALSIDPTDIDSRRRLGQWAKEDGDLPRARQILESVVRDDPAYVPARVLLAVVYRRLNLRKEAEEQQRTISSLQQESQNRQRPLQILTPLSDGSDMGDARQPTR
jgi:tetratricopeptide (TPR) repeat protein